MKKILFLLGIILFATFHTAYIFAEEPNIESLQKEITSLEKRVIVLENLLIDKQTNPGIENPAEINQDKNMIGLELLDMTFHESNASNDYANGYSDWLAFTFKFTNNSLKAIKAFKGAAVFADIFGEVWWRIGLSQNSVLQPNESINWDGQIDYNQFKDSNKKARYTDLKDIIVSFDPEQIFYSDGSKTKF